MKTKISFSLFLLAFILCFCVYPLNLLRSNANISSGDTEPYSTTPALNPGVKCTQAFIAQESYLKELSFAFSPIDSLPNDTIVTFELTDQSGNILTSKEYTSNDIVNQSYCTVSINKWLKKGALYSYTLSISGSKGNSLVLYTTPNPVNFASGNVNLFFNGVPLEGQAYNLYSYTRPLSKKNIFCTWTFIWLITMCVYTLYNKNTSN